jgi:pSer/pThr/pTyr-binding forkhead associated (FHA) protein
LIAKPILVAYDFNIQKSECRRRAMAKIRLMKKGQLLRELQITADRTQIGREQINQLRIMNPTISRFHAEIHRRGFCYSIEDKRSTNGTRLNGSLISKKESLYNHDQIVIGEFTLEFVIDDTDSPAPVNPESFDSSSTVYDLGSYR